MIWPLYSPRGKRKGDTSLPEASTRPAGVTKMDTSIQIGPTGKKLLPLTVKNAGPVPSGHAH